MQKGNSKLIKFISLLILVSVVPCMIINYIVDPLQFYRRSYLFNNVLYKYQRYQNPGLAKNYEYDTVIIGTSLTENFLPSDIKKVLGFDALKLSISGASANEQKSILQLAIDTRQVNNVLWGIDLSSFKGEAIRKNTQDNEFPGYLYDNNLFNDFKYLLNDKTTELSLTTLIRFFRFGPANKDINVDRYSFWYPYADFGETHMREKGKIFEETNIGLGLEYDLKEILRSADINLLKTIEENPFIDFYLFYTPASILREAFFIKEGIYDIEIEFKRYLNERLLKYKNVKLYDFQAAKEIILDLDRYSDYSHYDLATIVYMLEYIKRDRYLVTKDNTLLDEFDIIVKEYVKKNS